jgi:hypothetical protein
VFGLLVAVLPQVQPHSIIACIEWAVVFAFVSLFPFSKRRLHAAFVNYFIVAAISITIGLPQMTPYFGRAKKGFWRVAPIWKSEGAKSLLHMWWRSLGVLFAMGFFCGPPIMSLEQLRFYVPSFAVWIVSNYIWYQPWQLDNTKVFNAAWMPMILSAASCFLVALGRKRIIGRGVAGILIFFACFSGLLSTRMAIREMYPIWSPDDYPHELAEFVRTHSDPKSIWLLDDWHAHPVTTLAGRQSVLGYGGWTSSHGLGERSRREILSQLRANPESTKAADNFGVQFVCVRKRDKTSLTFPITPHSQHWRKVLDNVRYTVYERTTVA